MTSPDKTAAATVSLTGSIATASAPEHAHSGAKRLRMSEGERLVRKAIAAQRARAAAGCTNVDQLSARLGTSATVLKKQESRGEPHEPRFSEMLADRAYGLSLVTEVAGEHGSFVAPLPAVIDMPDAERHSRITVEAADVVRVVAVHAADGRHERHELEEQERELLELHAETLNRLAWVRAKLRGEM